jgi:serine/threonine protein kinase
MSISIFGDKIVHLAHSNPTVLDQWTSLLHQYIHKIGFNNDYALLDKIGEGVSASVHLGKAQKSGQKVAVKKFSKRKMDEKDLKALYNEINVMRMIEGQYFPKLIGTYLTENSIYLVMEYVSGVNLKELKEKGTLSSR